MIGAIADDFTGGTDVAVAFRRAGLRTAVFFGVPKDAPAPDEFDAVVVSLKTRTVAPEAAVQASLAAARWLQGLGVDQLYFKYCSTFDSTTSGNIGPVADALADLVGAGITAVVPSSPEHSRTMYNGHLFVGDKLLSDSPMRNHPLTPMTNSFIPEVLESQTARAVAKVTLETVRDGSSEVAAVLKRAEEHGARYVVIDAIDDVDLAEIGHAVAQAPLVTGAAGLAGGLGKARAHEFGRWATGRADGEDPVGAVRAAALAGSCSARTLEQISTMQTQQPSYRLDAVETPNSAELATAALAWFDEQDPASAPLIYSSLPPAELRATQAALGTEHASHLLETAMGLVAQGLVERGVQRIVVAGGETSGSVVSALAVDGGLIGDEAAPGVPWIYSNDDRHLALLLKSGNFGEIDLLKNAVQAGR